MSKPTTVKDPSKMNTAQLADYMAELKLLVDNAEKASATVRETETKKLNDQMVSFRTELGKTLGRELSAADFLNMVGAHVKGKLSFNSIGGVEPIVVNGDKAKRLTDETKTKIVEAHLARALAESRGQDPVSKAFTARTLKITVGTFDRWAPDAEAIAKHLAANPVVAPVVAAAPAV